MRKQFVLSVVVWLWHGEAGRDFRAEHVNTQWRNFARVLSVPHRFICVADSREGLDAAVEYVPTPDAAREIGRLRNPEGARFPSCYRRLWTFSEAAREVLGELVLQLDIDLVLVRDLAPILNRTEAFVGWRPLARWGNADRIGGGMFLLRTGTRTGVWEQFAGAPSVAAARAAGFRGSDQAWISYCLGRSAAVWPSGSGLYSIRDLRNGRDPLPSDARLVQFNGPTKPWMSPLPWVREHWRANDSVRNSTDAPQCVSTIN